MRIVSERVSERRKTIAPVRQLMSLKATVTAHTVSLKPNVAYLVFNFTSCGSGVRASRFLIGLVTCFAMHDGIPAVAHAARRR